MISMLEMINRLCDDDQALCEALVELYRHVDTTPPSAAIGVRLWQRIEQLHQNGKLGDVLGCKDRMRPCGIPLDVGGARVILVAGKCNDPFNVSYNQSVGPKVPERIVVNIGPYISKYYAENVVSVQNMESYNDIVYKILVANKEDILAKIDEVLRSRAKRDNIVDTSIDKFKEMYSTDPED